MNRRASHLSTRRKRDALLLLLILLLGSATLIALSSGSIQQANSGNGTPHAAFSPAATTASGAGGTPDATAGVLVRAAQSRLYPFPQSNAGLMQPAVDARGDIWVGEMYANRLARLDPHTGAVTSWETPNGQNGIMTTAIDARGNVWFVDQGANYIGRFDPVRQAFRIFPLGSAGGRSMGPQALQFDARGCLWFTAAVGGPGVLPSPYGLTVLPDEQIWFGDITGGAVGLLDPTTGRVTLYHLADPQETVFSLAHDARGRIWFSEITPGKLGMIDGTTGAITEWPVPTVSDHTAALYGVVVAPGGDIWFAANGINALVRYAPGTAAFTVFQISMASAGLYGLALAPSGTLWFTAAGQSTNYVGEMAP